MGKNCMPRMVRIPAANTSTFCSCVKSGTDVGLLTVLPSLLSSSVKLAKKNLQS